MRTMTWNYRIVRTTDDDGPVFGIHEVYYDGDKVVGWTGSSVSLVHDDVDLLLEHLQAMLEKPVLEEYVDASGADALRNYTTKEEY